MGKNDKKEAEFLVNTKENMIRIQTKVKKITNKCFNKLELKYLFVILLFLAAGVYGFYWYFFNFNSPQELDYERLKVEIEEELNQEVNQSFKQDQQLEAISNENQQTASKTIANDKTELFDRSKGEISEAKESAPVLDFDEQLNNSLSGQQQRENLADETEETATKRVGGEIQKLLLPAEGEKTNINQWYKDEVLDVWSFNPGLDIKVSAGSEVKAASGGKIEKIRDDNYLGTEVIIRHSSGLKTIYQNLTEVNFNQEDEVARGEKIALVKDNDYYSKDMIRVKIKRDNEYLEPEKYFPL